MLVAYGERDPHVRGLHRVAAAFRKAYPEAEVAVVPGAGHCVHLEEPLAVARVLRAFLERVHAPAAMAL